MALLAHFLVMFGNVIGRTAHFKVEATKHHPRLFAIMVSETGRGKGVAWSNNVNLFQYVDPDWLNERIVQGLSSGEGLISAVRDPSTNSSIRRRTEVADPGVKDKRLLVVEEEFGGPLQVMQREGNTLSAVIRTAWDGARLRTLTKLDSQVATDTHISMIGHITRKELIARLGQTEISNGFANRYLFFLVDKSKLLPDGTGINPEAIQALAERVRDAVTFARDTGELRRDAHARELWHQIYESLAVGHPGALGAVTSRGAAQVMRLACCYALLDLSQTITLDHLKAALAVWDYSFASCRQIFGDSLGDKVADRILDTAKEAYPDGVTRTELRNLFQRNILGRDLDSAVDLLSELGLIRVIWERTGRRPIQRIVAGTQQ